MIVIEAIVKDLKLDLVLTACFGETAGILLELVTYVVIEGANSSATYSDYAYRHPSVFSQGLPVTDETIEARISSLTGEAVKDFLAQWNDGQDQTARVYVTCDASQRIRVTANRTVAETNDDTINPCVRLTGSA